MKSTLCILFAGALLSGCVATRKFRASQEANATLRADSLAQAQKIAQLESQSQQQQQQISDLNNKVSDLNKQAGQLSSDVANKQNQLGQSQQQLAEQQAKLEHLQALMDQQKRATQEIRKRMGDALTGFSPNELTVSVKNGKVYVSMQESLLFPSGSAVVNPKGKLALGKLAEALNKDTSITVDIEGHTDSVPIHIRYIDNWDLSTSRSNAIVRILTKTYGVDPTRVIASGHSQYDPVETNSTPEGRQLNRRTEVILSPNLDELYRLLETGTE
ncbi:OmpA/MotB family protein [Dinghuibacter silviterrae]|uniref:Chemotaxis protein MotB n=1 Tax=Dinghuibacter silviterrae TaxID=1539049 RepID=A0A4R8DVB7_9BACT|nr:OmpA family protein [Dinghuibacter silviterrae]TDX02364.1 chemotaxis protein MotB [Dinghuibacter silviterrae]